MALNANRVFDLSKENIQPVKKKSETPTLKPFLQTNTISQTRPQLQKQRDHLENAISAYEGDDPLDPYCNYVIWLEQNFPKLGGDSNLIPLLEEIIVKYKDWETYKQDYRFVQLVVKYINTQTNSLELYQLVFNQGLGTKCSMLYLAWAEKLEKMRNFKEADRVFFLGINSGAQPLKVLEDTHIQFQLRIARNMLEENTSDAFSAFGKSKYPLSKLSFTNHKNNFTGGSTAGVAPSNSDKDHSKCSRLFKFRIYEEDENNQLHGDFKNWDKQLKSNVVSRNETKAIGKCHNLKKKQFHGTVSNQIAASLNRDVKKPSEVTKTMKSVLLKTKNDEFKCPVAIFELEDISKKPMYPKHLVYTEGNDIQLEEIRAMYYHQNMSKLNDLCDAKKATAEARAEHFASIRDEPVNLTKSCNASPEQKQLALVLNDKFKTGFGNTLLRKSASFSYDPLLGTQFVEPVSRTNYNDEMKWNRLDLAQLPKMVTENREEETEDCVFPSLLSKYNYIDKSDSSRNANYRRFTEIYEKNVSGSNECLTFPKFLPPWVQEKFESTIKLQKEDDSIDIRSGDHNTSTFHPSPSGSFTVNTRAAWNVIQKMWESPLAPQHSGDAASKDVDNSVFKKPHTRTPCRKISFPAFSDDEFNDERNKGGTRKSDDEKVSDCLEKTVFIPDFRVFADPVVDLQDTECKNALNGFRSTLDHVICPRNVQPDDIPAVKLEKRSYGNCENSNNRFDLPRVPNEMDLAGRMSSLNVNGFKEKHATPLPFIVPAKSKDMPVDESEDKENQAPKDYFTPSERRPVCGILTPATDIPVIEVDNEDSDDEDADVDYLVSEKNCQVDEDNCNLNAFDFFLPCSTPFSRIESIQHSRKSLIYNGSYILEEDMALGNPLPSVPKLDCDNLKKHNERSTANLSLILENSKEHGSSSSRSGAHVGTRNVF